MKAETFEKIWLDQVQIEKSILLERAAAYATGGDRLGNFYEGAQLTGRTPMQYAFGLVTKHVIALRDMIETGGGSPEKMEEYVTDIRNYAILIKALYMEARDENKS